MKYIVFTLFYFLSVNVKSCNEFNAICKAICKNDGDDLGVVIKDKCYCANYRSLDDVIVKVPKNGRVFVKDEPKPRSWFE